MGTLTTVAQQLSLDRQPSPDLLDLAYQRFLFDFVIPSAPHEPGMCPDGVLDFLPMYFYAASDSCLRAAIMAVCYANYDGRFKSAEARMLSSECCGKALTQMQAAIKDPVKAKSDETLLTVYLLGIWEVRTFLPFQPTGLIPPARNPCLPLGAFRISQPIHLMATGWPTKEVLLRF